MRAGSPPRARLPTPPTTTTIETPTTRETPGEKVEPEPEPEPEKKEKEKKKPTKKKGPDPLADKKREPDFVFTMGGPDGTETEAERGEKEREKRSKPREPERKDASEGSGGRFNNPEFQQHVRDTVARAKAKAAAKAEQAKSSKPGYTREKAGANIGDAVTELTQNDEARVNKAREEAERAKRQRDAKPTGATVDVKTEITLLTQDVFEEATALAQRMSDGVGLGRAGGLGGRAGPTGTRGRSRGLINAGGSSRSARGGRRRATCSCVSSRCYRRTTG